ncbi:MAG TPA: hypothetical protein VKM72_27090 [Thermoanaerobaculia bacterium]|nr:hypothetical protein [Thermoanaerobaculia bacterium]
MRRSILGLLAALLAAPLSAAAQEPATTTDPGFTEVQIDLGSRSFGQVLPFDVPFQITGAVPTGARSIQVQLARSRQPIDVQRPSPAPDDLDAQCQARAQGKVDGQIPWEPVPALRWDRVDLIDTGASPRFRITVPPLDAERYYLFRFDVLVDADPTQADAFKKKAEPILDEQFRKVSSLELSPAQSKSLRLALIRALREVVGPGNIIAQGTLFDPCTDHETMRNEFNRDFRAIMSQQQFRNVISLNRLGDLQRQIGPQLDALSSPALVGLVRRVQEKAQTDATAANLLQGAAGDAVQLALLAPGEAGDLASGVAPQGGQAAGDLFTTWSPSVVDQFAANYADTFQKLQTLQGWLEARLEPTPDPGLFAGVPEAEIEQLRALIAPDGAVEQARQTADSLQSGAAQLSNALEERQTAFQRMAAKYREQVAADVLVESSTTGNANTFQGYYVSADLGFVYLPDIDEGVPYMGTNIYFRPVNKNAPLSQRSSFGRRFAVTLGVTLDSIADDNQTRQDLTGNQSLVVGAGYRFTESLRFGLGAVVFLKKDPNPLVDDETTGVTPYVSVSFDWNVAKTFKGLSTAFFGNAN